VTGVAYVAPMTEREALEVIAAEAARARPQATSIFAVAMTALGYVRRDGRWEPA
jgi:hypothetical protein